MKKKLKIRYASTGSEEEWERGSNKAIKTLPDASKNKKTFRILNFILIVYFGGFLLTGCSLIKFDRKIENTPKEISTKVSGMQTYTGDEMFFYFLLALLIGASIPVYLLIRTKMEHKEIVNEKEKKINTLIEESDKENVAYIKKVKKLEIEVSIHKKDIKRLQELKKELDHIEIRRLRKDLELEKTRLEDMSDAKKDLEHNLITLKESIDNNKIDEILLLEIINTIDTIRIFKNQFSSEEYQNNIKFIENQLQDILFNHEVKEHSPTPGDSLIGNKNLSSLCEIKEKEPISKGSQTPGTIVEVFSPGYITKEGKVIKKASVRVYTN